MTDDLRTRIAAALKAEAEKRGIYKIADFDFPFMADAVIAELNIPDRTHVDDEGRVWEWCGGQPGTWAWRITSLHKRDRDALRDLTRWGLENQPDDD